jgi:Fe-S-cluster containining protein
VAFRFPSAGDQKLIQIVDAALADVTRSSKGGLVCRKGCTQCCIGVFAINQLDAARLRRGLAQLAVRDPEQAAAVRQRARDSVRRLAREFPGDPATGLLGDTKKELQRFEAFANEEPCPALDPDEGTCDLYESRPMTCRVFGPPVRAEDGLGVCELCYNGFSETEIAACEMIPDPEDLESRVLKEVERATGLSGETIIAFALTA